MRRKPRSWKNSDAPGSYSIASRVSENIINPGDTLRFEQYLTGYGEIKKCKMQCYISSDIFDHSSSKILTSIGTRKNGDIYWGATEHGISGPGFYCEFQGVGSSDWEDMTIFIDSDSIGHLITEIQIENAPYSYSLKTRKNIKPGNHYLDFYLTYFNGDEWKTSKERVDFKVNNFFEKYSTAISVLASLALAVTIIHDGAGPLLELIHDLGKYIMSRR